METNDDWINDFDTISSLFPNREYEKIKDNKKFISFCSALKTIQDVCRERRICLGEAVIVIAKNFGYIWDTIPFSKIGEIREFWINNWFRVFAILEPEKHAEFMISNNEGLLLYQSWYNSRDEMGNQTMRQAYSQAEKISEELSDKFSIPETRNQ
jgi:hypothetical protein